MRRVLSALTLRGRAFLAAGGTCLACAMLLDQPALARIAVLLIVLPLLSVLLLTRTQQRLSLVRGLNPGVVTAGQSCRVDLVLGNDGTRGSGRLLLEEQVPYALGGRPRFVIDGVPPAGSRQLSYQVRPDLRGHYQIGPMAIRSGDPFGMVESRRSFQGYSALVVTPRTVDLPEIPLRGAWTGSGENRPRAFATGSAEDVTVREYRDGDDLRRVHWRSTARSGDLMVRREEQPWQSRATILLDNRELAYRGPGGAASFEEAVTAAASVALHLSERGYGLRLVTAIGEETGGRWHELGGRAGMALLLEELAIVSLLDRHRLEGSWLTSGSGGLVIGVFGQVDPGDRPSLHQIRAHSEQCLALSLGPDASLLAALGWRTGDVGAQGSLSSAWQQLGRSR